MNTLGQSATNFALLGSWSSAGLFCSVTEDSDGRIVQAARFVVWWTCKQAKGVKCCVILQSALSRDETLIQQ
jgi:hypothetical protein